MCDRVVWMQNGSVRMQGEADYVLKQYELDFRKAEDEAMVSKRLGGSPSANTGISPNEIVDTDCARFRIVANKTTYFSATHFIRAIRIHGLAAEAIEVPLEFSDLTDKKDLVALDLLDTEWGISDNNRKAKYYQLTAAGRKRLREETAGWQRLSAVMATALRATREEI